MTCEEAARIIEDYEVNGCGYCHQGKGPEIEEAFAMAADALRICGKGAGETRDGGGA